MPVAALALALALAQGPAAAPGAAGQGAAATRVTAGPKDKCPVCGMFVARYPDWLAGATFADGARFLFDGPKDLVKFWLDPARYLPARRREDIAAVFVTDYYAVSQVDARAALFVVGSDVLGPMGRELVPFARREDAEEFLRDHKGERILRLDEITPALVAALEG